jgi:hypothetical protein
VPAIGLTSPRQNIPRGEGADGASFDRQFTGRCCGPEMIVKKKKSVQHSTVRMRRRSCHFCGPCMRLDPTDNANQGVGTCKYEQLCGPADNVVGVAKEASKTTQITRSSVRAAEHVEVVKRGCCRCSRRSSLQKGAGGVVPGRRHESIVQAKRYFLGPSWRKG